MSENKPDIKMSDVDFKRVRVNQRVIGTIFQVNPTVIYVTLETNEEARIHKDHYGKEIESFKDEVQVGDQIEAFVSKIIDDEKSGQIILLDRKKILKSENAQKVEEAYKNEEVINLKITRVNEKGLHFDAYGYDAFLPFGLLDKELIEKKEELINTYLDVNIIEAKFGRGNFKPRIIASRKKIFEEIRDKEREVRENNRQNEFDSIKTGDVLTGRVEKILKYKAIIRFEYITGSLRISQITHSRLARIKDELTVGDEVKVKVISKEDKNGRYLDLSMKELLPTPLENFAKEHQKGDKVIGKVVQKLPFGMILEIDEGVRGLLHQSEYSWNPNDNLQSHLKVEDKIEVVVTDINMAENKIRFSRRHLLENPWENVHFYKGEEVECKIIGISEERLEIEAKGVNGFVPAREITMKKVDNPHTLYAEGEKVKALVMEVNARNWHLSLSIKRYEIKQEEKEVEKYSAANVEVKTNVGDLFPELFEDDNEE